MITRLDNLKQPFKIDERGSRYLDKLHADIALLKQHIGICEICGEHFVHDCDEPFAYCACGTSKWPYTDLSQEPLIIQRDIYHSRCVHLTDSKSLPS